MLPGGAADMPLSRGPRKQSQKVHLSADAPSQERGLCQPSAASSPAILITKVLQKRAVLLMFSLLLEDKRRTKTSRTLPDLGSLVFVSSSSVSSSTLSIHLFFALIQILQSTPHHQTSQLEKTMQGQGRKVRANSNKEYKHVCLEV